MGVVDDTTWAGMLNPNLEDHQGHALGLPVRNLVSLGVTWEAGRPGWKAKVNSLTVSGA
jgi:hypothetical protein